ISMRITRGSRASCETTISGVVTDLSGTPLEGALVSIVGGDATYTDVDGSFVLGVLSTGFYLLEFYPPVPCGTDPPYPLTSKKVLAYECQDNPINPTRICSGN